MAFSLFKKGPYIFIPNRINKNGIEMLVPPVEFIHKANNTIQIYTKL